MAYFYRPDTFVLRDRQAGCAELAGLIVRPVQCKITPQDCSGSESIIRKAMGVEFLELSIAKGWPSKDRGLPRYAFVPACVAAFQHVGIDQGNGALE
jgi:hypothetical protein